MVFDEWWYKHGVELGIKKNDACTVWMAALNNAEALKPSHNTQIMPVCPNFGTLPVHDDDTGGVINWHVCKSAGKPA